MSMSMTLNQLIARWDAAGFPRDWEIRLETPTEYLTLEDISIMGQGEVGLVFDKPVVVAPEALNTLM